MVAIASFCGGTYASSTFTLSWTALNAQLTALGLATVTAQDSAEKLMWCLLMILNGKGLAGTLSEPTCGAQVSRTGQTFSTTWETSNATFSVCDTVGIEAQFRLVAAATGNTGNNIANVCLTHQTLVNFFYCLLSIACTYVRQSYIGTY